MSKSKEDKDLTLTKFINSVFASCLGKEIRKFYETTNHTTEEGKANNNLYHKGITACREKKDFSILNSIIAKHNLELRFIYTEGFYRIIDQHNNKFLEVDEDF